MKIVTKQDRESLISFLTKHAEITLEIQPEDTEIRGNASAWGDGTDEAYADELIARVNAGDEWAWFCALVTAEYEGFTGSDSLGGCSYASRADFMSTEANGYYADMQRAAISNLADEIIEAAEPPIPVTPEPDPEALAVIARAMSVALVGERVHFNACRECGVVVDEFCTEHPKAIVESMIGGRS